MVENVKRRRARSYWLLTVAVGVVIMAVVIWVAFYMDKGYDSDAVAYVDGRIETGNNAVDMAVAKMEGSDPADVISDGLGKDQTRVAIVFKGITDEADTNADILELLKENNIKASFALSAAEGLDDTEFVDAMLENGSELISNGTDGESSLHDMSAHDMVEVMLKSREKLSTSADTAVPLLYCSSTKITSDVLRAAAVSGYDAVIDPEAQNVLDRSSFADESDAVKFAGTLSGDEIVVIDLRGFNEETADESAVTVEKPAVDKQPDADDPVKEEAAEPTPILTQVGWLIRSICDRGITTEYVSAFERTDGSQLLREKVDEADPALSVVWRYALTDQNVIGIGMRGMPEGKALESLLSALKKNDTEMTFFLTADELRKRKDDIERVIKAGCTVGMTGNNIQSSSRADVYEMMQDGAAVLRSYTDGASLYLVDDENNAENIDAARAAAQLLGVRIVEPETQKKPFAGALYMISGKRTETIADLKKRARREGLSVTDIQSVVNDAGNISLLSAKDISAMRRKNDHALADAQNMVYTTERSVAMMFFNAENDTVVRDAVGHLALNNAKGTFFVTFDELSKHPSSIEYILKNGDELGICYRADGDHPQTFDSVMNYINAWRRYAEWRYGIDAKAVYMPSDEPADETREAVKVSGCQLVRSAFSVVKNEDKDITVDNVSQAMDRIENMRVMRGSMVSFNMSFYENDIGAAPGNTVLGAVIDAFVKEHIDSLAYRNRDGVIEDASRFNVTTVSSVLDSPEKYTFCEDKQDDITIDKNVLTDMKTDEERFDRIAAGYYGNVTVDVADKLPGFTPSEISKLDKSGTFTDDKVIFLTFDDWGTEKSINELLYVLQKHDVKGTFFVKTQYIDANPNLLRTIAVQGHQIASHTDGHIPLADTDPKNENKMYSLTEEEAAALRKDLVLAYDKLYKYTGNVVVNGKKALTPMFRPPTLAVSKTGMSQVFDVGYQYSISGAYSTGDYQASSYDDMISRLKRRKIGQNKYIKVHNGTVIVMHMQENAKYTAQALDAMIPVWEQEGYRFARIDEYLGK